MISEDLRQLILTSIPQAHIGLLLFGSHARGDATISSDIDVLMLVDEPAKSYRSGTVSVSAYTRSHLLQLARHGSLFVRHIVDEALSVENGDSILEELRRNLRIPASYSTLRNDILASTALLDVDAATFNKHRAGLAEAAKYISRTLLYAELADRKLLTFNFEAAATLGDAQDLLRVPKDCNVWQHSDLKTIQSWLSARLGCIAQNTSSTLEALILNAHGRSELTVVLGLRILGAAASSPYEDLQFAAGVHHDI